MEEAEFDIVIVGLGPVGATLANLLGLSGMKTLVLEKEAEAYHLPRAVQFDDEVMRVFQSIGLAKPVEAISRINPGMQFVDMDGTLLLDWPRPPGVSKLGWKSSYRFHQPDLEEILREGLKRFDHVAVKTLREVYSIDEVSQMATIHFRQRETGEQFQTTARYVVGCDGARSFVRQAMGCEIEDFGFEEKWLVVDLVLNRDMPHLGDHTIQYCNPDRPSTYVRGPGLRRRWEITVKPDEDPDEIVGDDRVWDLLGRWLLPNDARLVRRAVYQFQSSIAASWRKGRMMIAGDAAHLMPPFMGQGMCTGIRDVFNLAWKLSSCVLTEREGGDCSRMLDSYGVERMPHVREYIATAIKLGGLINASGSLDDLNAAFRQPDGSVKMNMIEPKLGESAALHHSKCSGKICPQPIFDDGQLLDDCLDNFEWMLIHRMESREIDMFGSELAGKLRIIDGHSQTAVNSILENLNVAAILARPDRYIYGTANSTEELEHLLQCAIPMVEAGCKAK